MDVRVTRSAALRYGERVEPCSLERARASILSHSRAIEAAADFGCQVVRCGTGERLVLEGATVVGVYERGNLPRQCRSPFREGRF